MAKAVESYTPGLETAAKCDHSRAQGNRSIDRNNLFQRRALAQCGSSLASRVRDKDVSTPVYRYPKGIIETTIEVLRCGTGTNESINRDNLNHCFITRDCDKDVSAGIHRQPLRLGEAAGYCVHR